MIPHKPDLTPRELQVARLILKGRTNRQMAEDLGISIHTVAAYRSKIMKKCQVNSVAGLVRCLEEYGLVSSQENGQ